MASVFFSNSKFAKLEFNCFRLISPISVNMNCNLCIQSHHCTKILAAKCKLDYVRNSIQFYLEFRGKDKHGIFRYPFVHSKYKIETR